MHPKVLSSFAMRLKKAQIKLGQEINNGSCNKIYENEVRYVNDALINAAYEGLAFKDKSKVIFPHKV